MKHPDLVSTGVVLVLMTCVATVPVTVGGQSTAPAALAGVPVFRADPSWPVLPADWKWGQVWEFAFAGTRSSR